MNYEESNAIITHLHVEAGASANRRVIRAEWTRSPKGTKHRVRWTHTNEVRRGHRRIFVARRVNINEKIADESCTRYVVRRNVMLWLIGLLCRGDEMFTSCDVWSSFQCGNEERDIDALPHYIPDDLLLLHRWMAKRDFVQSRNQFLLPRYLYCSWSIVKIGAEDFWFSRAKTSATPYRNENKKKKTFGKWGRTDNTRNVVTQAQ